MQIAGSISVSLIENPQIFDLGDWVELDDYYYEVVKIDGETLTLFYIDPDSHYPEEVSKH